LERHGGTNLTITAIDEFVAERERLVKVQQRKARRAEAARRTYAENKARGIIRASSQARPGEHPRPRPRKPKYDAEDYADEWRDLTAWGLNAEEIIRRSDPCRDWFFDHVRMLVNDAICASCGGHFSPKRTRLLTKCDKACGRDRGNDKVVSLLGR
jgi:hypothetical protein